MAPGRSLFRCDDTGVVRFWNRGASQVHDMPESIWHDGEAGDDPRTVHSSSKKGINVRSGLLLSCCGCVGGLVLASVVVWPLVRVSVSRCFGVLPLLWLGRFRPRWALLGKLF